MFRIVSDNVDFSVKARIQTKSRGNQSIHWTHQYAIKDRISFHRSEDAKPQKPIAELQLIELLPDAEVIRAVQSSFIVLVSRVVTKFLKHFQFLKDVVIHHIPHKYSDEMAKKSELVSTFAYSWNLPNYPYLLRAMHNKAIWAPMNSTCLTIFDI